MDVKLQNANECELPVDFHYTNVSGLQTSHRESCKLSCFLFNNKYLFFLDTLKILNGRSVLSQLINNNNKSNLLKMHFH